MLIFLMSMKTNYNFEYDLCPFNDHFVDAEGRKYYNCSTLLEKSTRNGDIENNTYELHMVIKSTVGRIIITKYS